MLKKNISKKIVLLLGISFIFFLILASNTSTQWAQDSHWHLSLAKSFSSGEGYSFEGDESPHGKYPPGLTILMTPFQLFFQDIQLAGLIMAGIISLLNIILIYKIGGIFNRKTGLLAATFLIFHNLFVFNSVSVMTELPFMFFSLASIYFFINGFENEKLFLFSMISFSLASLIRYDGFLILPVLLVYTYKRREKLKELDLNYVLLGILTSSILLGGWFIRNWIVFGSPLASAYTSEVDPINLLNYGKFMLLFLKTGYLFPLLVLMGGYFIIKENNPKFKPFLIWVIIYLGLHMYWSHRVLRFYVEILGIFCILAAFGTYGLINWLRLNKKREKIFLGIILILFIISQSLIFFFWPNGEAGLITLNRYDSIKEISEYANKNLPNDSIYAVVDYAVYNLYLEKSTIVSYNQGINLLNQGFSVYILTDTLHPWATGPFMEGENGFIILSANNGKAIVIETRKIFESEKKERRALILEPTGISIN